MHKYILNNNGDSLTKTYAADIFMEFRLDETLLYVSRETLNYLDYRGNTNESGCI